MHIINKPKEKKQNKIVNEILNLLKNKNTLVSLQILSELRERILVSSVLK